MATLLLDTHAFLWWLNDDKELGPDARSEIEDPDNVILVSAATAWEIAIKRERGKLEAPGDIAGWVTDSDFVSLPVEVEHAIAAAELPAHHKDPFDRLLIAQAQFEDLILVTSDDDIKKYDVEIVDAST